jgi:hypothetical protein
MRRDEDHRQIRPLGSGQARDFNAAGTWTKMDVRQQGLNAAVGPLGDRRRFMGVSRPHDDVTGRLQRFVHELRNHSVVFDE